MAASSDSHEIKLSGGNVGGAVRVGNTVRRQQGPWTPAVHALLNYLHGRVPAIPQVLGTDDQGREILSYLPGRVIDADTERLSDEQIVSLVRWTLGFHQAIAGFTHPGPWRFFPVTQPSLICHNDIAPYNACFAGDEVTGVFDWDLAGPSTPLFELAFIAWNCVPLWRDIGPDNAAQRLGLIALAYGEFTASQILHAVPDRIHRMLEWIPVAAAAGDDGMANVMRAGEPGRSAAALAGLVSRIPAMDRLLLDQRLRRPLRRNGFGAELQLGSHEVTRDRFARSGQPRPGSATSAAAAQLRCLSCPPRRRRDCGRIEWPVCSSARGGLRERRSKVRWSRLVVAIHRPEGVDELVSLASRCGAPTASACQCQVASSAAGPGTRRTLGPQAGDRILEQFSQPHRAPRGNRAHQTARRTAQGTGGPRFRRGTDLEPHRRGRAHPGA